MIINATNRHWPVGLRRVLMLLTFCLAVASVQMMYYVGVQGEFVRGLTIQGAYALPVFGALVAALYLGVSGQRRAFARLLTATSLVNGLFCVTFLAADLRVLAHLAAIPCGGHAAWGAVVLTNMLWNGAVLAIAAAMAFYLLRHELSTPAGRPTSA